MNGWGHLSEILNLDIVYDLLINNWFSVCLGTWIDLSMSNSVYWLKCNSRVGVFCHKCQWKTSKISLIVIIKNENDWPPVIVSIISIECVQQPEFISFIWYLIKMPISLHFPLNNKTSFIPSKGYHLGERYLYCSEQTLQFQFFNAKIDHFVDIFWGEWLTNCWASTSIHTSTSKCCSGNTYFYRLEWGCNTDSKVFKAINKSHPIKWRKMQT